MDEKKARCGSGLEVHIKGGDMEETGASIGRAKIYIQFPFWI
jgi:hypothetical protein